MKCSLKQRKFPQLIKEEIQQNQRKTVQKFGNTYNFDGVKRREEKNGYRSVKKEKKGKNVTKKI